MEQARSTVLEADDLSVARGGRLVVEDISLDLRAHEMVCLVGRSGSGKTTLFHALAGLLQPESGRVLLNGEDITGCAGHISYMLQKDLLLEHRTVVDNVALPLIIKGTAKSEARRRASARFSEFGLDGMQDRYPSELSGGMRQRAALLRTYMNNSDVVLMDEPFSALDALTRSDMRRWFLKMMDKLGFASVLITHDVDEAIELADRILVLGHMRGDRSDPSASTVIASVDVPCPRSSREGFILSEDALGIKREVISYLEEDEGIHRLES